jgi:hypothetical protein
MMAYSQFQRTMGIITKCIGKTGAILMKQPTGFLGTYFDSGSVLRLELWARIIAWGVLAAYAFEAGYNAYQTVYGAIVGGYPLDWYSVYITLSHVLQGAVLFFILQIAAKAMLILLDIEDNTRRIARINSKES